MACMPIQAQKENRSPLTSAGPHRPPSMELTSALGHISMHRKSISQAVPMGTAAAWLNSDRQAPPATRWLALGSSHSPPPVVSLWTGTSMSSSPSCLSLPLLLLLLALSWLPLLTFGAMQKSMAKATPKKQGCGMQDGKVTTVAAGWRPAMTKRAVNNRHFICCFMAVLLRKCFAGCLDHRNKLWESQSYLITCITADFWQTRGFQPSALGFTKAQTC